LKKRGFKGRKGEIWEGRKQQQKKFKIYGKSIRATLKDLKTEE